ncbi:MAG: 2-amino-4-hydroxy-6-hydroxymethyldihydropteridine diphosphokinase [Desulfuromonas sp.]|nr:MAG: 2-amino-4-hydroxy-6-hydroxymethyldihydropteridine diphosphokinase [Desulfuromonas sp.]
MNTAYLGIGSNLGERLELLRQGRRRLEAAPGVRLLRSSPLYETVPQGGPAGQGLFFNAVLELQTTLSAEALLRLCLQIEAEAGRERLIHHGPRTLDLDLLLYDEQCCDSDELTLPHPRLHERRFVLVPLCDLRPELVHPRIGLSLSDLLAQLHDNGVTLRHKDW